MAEVRITPPDHFTFSRPEEWTKWIRRFERFQQASEGTGQPNPHTYLHDGGRDGRHPQLVSTYRRSSEELRRCRREVRGTKVRSAAPRRG